MAVFISYNYTIGTESFGSGYAIRDGDTLPTPLELQGIIREIKRESSWHDNVSLIPVNVLLLPNDPA